MKLLLVGLLVTAVAVVAAGDVGNDEARLPLGPREKPAEKEENQGLKDLEAILNAFHRERESRGSPASSIGHDAYSGGSPSSSIDYPSGMYAFGLGIQPGDDEEIDPEDSSANPGNPFVNPIDKESGSSPARPTGFEDNQPGLDDCMAKHREKGCDDQQVEDACRECDHVDDCVLNMLVGCTMDDERFSPSPSPSPSPSAGPHVENPHPSASSESPPPRSCYINKECTTEGDKCVHGTCQNAPDHAQESYFYAVDVNEEGSFHTELSKALGALSSDDLKPVSPDQIIPEDNLHMTVAHLGFADADAITELVAKIKAAKHTGFLLRPKEFVVSLSKGPKPIARSIRTIFEVVDDHADGEENNFQKIRRSILKLVNLEETLNSARVSASGHVTTIRFMDEKTKKSTHTPEEAQKIADALNEALQRDDSSMRGISIPVTKIELLKSVTRGDKKIYEHVAGMDIDMEAPAMDTFSQEMASRPIHLPKPPAEDAAKRGAKLENPTQKLADKAWARHNAGVSSSERVEPVPVKAPPPHPKHQSLFDREAEEAWAKHDKETHSGDTKAPAPTTHGVAELAEEPAMGEWVPYPVSLRGKH